MEAAGTEAAWTEQVEKIQQQMWKGFSEQVLPTVFREISPLIKDYVASELMPVMKREIVEATRGIVMEMKNEITNDMHWRQYSSFDVNKFWEENSEKLCKDEGLRDNALRKAKRLESTLNLYHELLDTYPQYVPRKFRKDRYHIKCREELEVLQKREKNEMKSEMEILRLRLVRNQKRVQHQDDLFEIFV